MNRNQNCPFVQPKSMPFPNIPESRLPEGPIFATSQSNDETALATHWMAFWPGIGHLTLVLDSMPIRPSYMGSRRSILTWVEQMLHYSRGKVGFWVLISFVPFYGVNNSDCTYIMYVCKFIDKCDAKSREWVCIPCTIVWIHVKQLTVTQNSSSRSEFLHVAQLIETAHGIIVKTAATTDHLVYMPWEGVHM